jgi:glutamate synthase (NADPH/NADH) large chain
MMIPEAWENHETMSEPRRDFYRFHSALMEPWDGPACITFTDGHQIGAVLDRNGLRPSRFWITKDGLVVLASEVGVLDIPQERVLRKGRLQPGKMFLVDLDAGRIIEDDEIKDSLAKTAPYGEWLHAGMVRLEDIPAREHIWLHRGGDSFNHYSNGKDWRRTNRFHGNRYSSRRTFRETKITF